MKILKLLTLSLMLGLEVCSAKAQTNQSVLGMPVLAALPTNDVLWVIDPSGPGTNYQITWFAISNQLWKQWSAAVTNAAADVTNGGTASISISGNAQTANNSNFGGAVAATNGTAYLNWPVVPTNQIPSWVLATNWWMGVLTNHPTLIATNYSNSPSGVPYFFKVLYP